MNTTSLLIISATLLVCGADPVPVQNDILPNVQCFNDPSLLVHEKVYNAVVNVGPTCSPLTSNSTEFVNKTCLYLKSWNVCDLINKDEDKDEDKDDFLLSVEALFENNIALEIKPEEMTLKLQDLNITNVEEHCKNNKELCHFYMAIDQSMRKKYQEAVEDYGYARMDIFFHSLKNFIAFPRDTELHADTRQCRDEKHTGTDAVKKACSVLAAVSVKNQMDHAPFTKTKDIVKYLQNTSIPQPHVPCEDLLKYEKIVTVDDCNERCNTNVEKETAVICKLAAFGLQYNNNGKDVQGEPDGTSGGESPAELPENVPSKIAITAKPKTGSHANEENIEDVTTTDKIPPNVANSKEDKEDNTVEKNTTTDKIPPNVANTKEDNTVEKNTTTDKIPPIVTNTNEGDTVEDNKTKGEITHNGETGDKNNNGMNTTTPLSTSTTPMNQAEITAKPPPVANPDTSLTDDEGSGDTVESGVKSDGDFADSDEKGINFMSYFIVLTVVCIAGYLLFHNKKKILALVLEGRGGEGGRRPSTKQYKRLKTEDVMPSMEKSASKNTYVF